MPHPADIVLIAGSPSPSSRSAAALEYIAHALHQEHQDTHTLFARDLVATALSVSNPSEHPAIQSAAVVVQNARAVVVATPVYNAAYSGVLKTFLDLLPQKILTGKVVFPVATGGSLAHLLAIEYALKPVLSALGARHILQGVYLTDAQITWVAGTKTAYSTVFRIEESEENRLFEGVTTLLHSVYGSMIATRPGAVSGGKDLALPATGDHEKGTINE